MTSDATATGTNRKLFMNAYSSFGLIA